MELTYEYLGLGPNPQLTDYEDVWEYQKQVLGHVADGEWGPHVIFTHHSPVYTAGHQTDPKEYPKDGTPVIDVDRGGHITYHGPGQLVCYPIVHLRDGVGVVDHLRLLEDAIIEFLQSLGLAPVKMPGRTGVWFPADGDRPDRKIAAIGVRVARRTTMHGFALNVHPSTEAFGNIIPCGIDDAGVTSIDEEKQGDWNVWRLAEAMEPILTRHLQREI